MSKEKFPKWAPKEVVEAYLRLGKLLDKHLPGDQVTASGPIQRRKEVFRNLVTHKGMARVWPKIEKRKDRQFDSAIQLSDGTLDYANAVWRALEPASPFERLTPSARKALELRTIQKCQELASLLDTCWLDGSVLEYFHDSEFQSLQFDLAGYDWDIDKNNLDRRLAELPALSLRNPAYNGMTPRISDILDRLIERLNLSPPSKKAILKRPGAKASNVDLFIKSISRHNQKKYQSPLYEVIAETAAVFFPKSVFDKDQIREKVRTDS